MTPTENPKSEIQNPKSPTPSIADSPLLWICLFLGMAVVGVSLIGPKYERRQTGIEQRYHMREHVHRLQSTESIDETFEPPSNLIHAWRPLLQLLLVAFLVTYAALLRKRWQMRRAATNIDESPTNPPYNESRRDPSDG